MSIQVFKTKVDVVSQPSTVIAGMSSLPAGTNNIGDVDLASPLPAGTNNIGDVDVLTSPMVHRNIPSGATIHVLQQNVGGLTILRTIPTGKTFTICYAGCRHDGTNVGWVTVRDLADAYVTTLALQTDSADRRWNSTNILPGYEVPAGYDIVGQGCCLVIGYEV